MLIKSGFAGVLHRPKGVSFDYITPPSPPPGKPSTTSPRLHWEPLRDVSTWQSEEQSHQTIDQTTSVHCVLSDTTLSSPCLKLYPSVQLQFGCKNVMHLQARSLPCRLFGDEFEYRFWKVALHFMTLERLRISKSQYRVGYEYHYQGWICRCTMYTGGGVGTASCTMWSYVSSIHSSPFR